MDQVVKQRKKYHVLGDLDSGTDDEDGQEHGLEQGGSEGHTEQLPSIHDVDATHIPEDIWEAAVASPDEGRAVIHAFNELHTTRVLCSEQLMAIRESRALFNTKSARATQLPPLTGAKYTATATASSEYPRSHKASATISSRIASDAAERKLSRYEHQANVWAEAVAALADRTQRMESDLAMQRGPEYRAKLELMEVLNRALPVQDRGDGSSVWAMSLRNAWERIVPLGSLLSGLFCTIHDMPSDSMLQPKQRQMLEEKLIKIGRPLDPALGIGGYDKALASTHGMEKPTLGRSLPTRGRDWSNSQVLQERLRQHAAAITRNGGYQPDMSGLKLEGHSVVELALEAARMPVTLEEVQAHLREADPEAYQSLQKAWDQAARRKAAAAAAEAAAEQAAQMEAQIAEATARKRARPGPHVRVSTAAMSLCSTANGKDRAVFELVHEGTTALYYRWHRVVPPPHPFAPSAHAVAQGSPHGPSPFHLARTSGVLLPNETHVVVVDFVPPKPGMYTEVWQLVTTPQLLLGPQDATHQADTLLQPSTAGVNSTASPLHGVSPQASYAGSQQQQQVLLQQVDAQHAAGVPSELANAAGRAQLVCSGASAGGGGGSGGSQGLAHDSVHACPPPPDAVSVTVRGVATVEAVQVLERGALARALDQAEKESKVRQALEHILRCVDAPFPPPIPEPPSQAEQALAWDHAQCMCWPPMYFPGPEVYAQLEASYNEARGEVYCLRAEAAEHVEAPASKAKKGAKAGKGKDKDVPQMPEAPLREFPEQWGGGLHELYAVLGELEDMHQATKATLLESQEAGQGTSTSKSAAAAAAEAAAAAMQAAEQALARVEELRSQAATLQLSTQALHVPNDARTLMRHAMRGALGRVADAVEAKLMAVHADYEKRVAEQEAEGAVVVPGKEVGPQWLADKCRAGTKAQTRNLVPWLFEEVAREKGAIGDWLEARIADLDARIAAVEAGATDPGPGNEVDAALESAAWAAEARRQKAALEAAMTAAAPVASSKAEDGSGEAEGVVAGSEPQAEGAEPGITQPSPIARLKSPRSQRSVSRRNQNSTGSQNSIRSREGGGRGSTPPAGTAVEVPPEAAPAPPCDTGAAAALAAEDTIEAAFDARATLERLYWIKFMRLRDWSRHGIPARGSIH